MISGSVLIWIFIVVFIFLLAALFVFCSCYGDNSTKLPGSSSNNGGCSTKETKATPNNKKQCSCIYKFKGLCEVCQVSTFVNDRPSRLPDCANYGGHLGLDGVGIGPQAKVDPNNRGFMGKSSNPWSGPNPGTIKQGHFV